MTNKCYFCGTDLIDLGGFGVHIAECPNMECKNKEKYPTSSLMVKFKEVKNVNYTNSNN